MERASIVASVRLDAFACSVLRCIDTLQQLASTKAHHVPSLAAFSKSFQKEKRLVKG